VGKAIHCGTCGRALMRSRKVWFHVLPFGDRDYIPHAAQPTPAYAPCCEAYLAEGAQLIALWSAPDSGVDPQAIADVRATNDKVRAGEPCPWHDTPEWGPRGWRNYLAVMKMAGEPDFEKRLGPITIIKDIAR
jgi:hypothetical protein